MDKAHEKMWTNTKEYYELLLTKVTSTKEEEWFKRRIKSCENLLSSC